MWILMLVLLLADDTQSVRRQAELGNPQAQYKAVQLARAGKLKKVSALQIDHWLRNAAQQGVVPARYEFAMKLLDATAAEDEPKRFEGLAWLAISARAGYQPAVRRWHMVAQTLGVEELEIVEQKTKLLVGAAVQPPKIAVQ